MYKRLSSTHPLPLVVSELESRRVTRLQRLICHVRKNQVDCKNSRRYIRQIGQPVSQLDNMAAQVQSALASAERVFELLDAPERL